VAAWERSGDSSCTGGVRTSGVEENLKESGGLPASSCAGKTEAGGSFSGGRKMGNDGVTGFLYERSWGGGRGPWRKQCRAAMAGEAATWQPLQRAAIRRCSGA
jgi:hypothetical protein